MGLLLMDTRDHFSVIEMKLFKNERRGPRPWLNSDSAQGDQPIQHWITQALARQWAFPSVILKLTGPLADLAAS